MLCYVQSPLRSTHPGAAERVADHVQGRDGRPEQVVGAEDEQPVLDDARDVHRQRARLADQQEHRLARTACGQMNTVFYNLCIW